MAGMSTVFKDVLAPGGSRFNTPFTGQAFDPWKFALDTFGPPILRNDFVDDGDGVESGGDYISGSGDAYGNGRTYRDGRGDPTGSYKGPATISGPGTSVAGTGPLSTPSSKNAQPGLDGSFMEATFLKPQDLDIGFLDPRKQGGGNSGVRDQLLALLMGGNKRARF